MKVEIFNPLDTLDKCKIMLAQCRETAGASIDNKADRLTVLHQLEITEILLCALERPLQSIDLIPEIEVLDKITGLSK